MSHGIIYASLAYIAWGLFPLYFRHLASVPALEVIMHRTLWSLVFLVLVLLWRRQWGWLALVLRQPRVLGAFALSALLLAGNWLIYVWAVSNGHVVDASLGYFILPLVNVAMGYALLHERPRRLQWVAVALAALGVAWLTWQAGHVPWIALALAMTFAIYGLLRKTATLGSLEGLSLETCMLAPIAMVCLGWWGWQGTAAWVHADAVQWAWLVAVGPVTAIPLLLFAAGARRIALSTMGVLQYLSPSLQFACGVWAFGETVDSARLAGFALIWAALVLFTLEGLWRGRRLALRTEFTAK
jgi:chloramphenicol-sensitive protein RarD